MLYTTIKKVRGISGFQDSANINDATVKGKIIMATGMVNGALVRKYVLPLPYHRVASIHFSGVGTGPGDIKIIVNGHEYTVIIENGLTALQAAEKFVNEAYMNEDFIMDYYLNEDESATVDLISISDSATLDQANEQVNVTQVGGLVAGINSTKSILVLDRFPPMVDQITAEIAANMLLSDNYGAEAQDTGKDGEVKMDLITKVLLQIQGKDDTMPDLKIVDEVTMQELPTAHIMPGFNEEASNDRPLVTMDKVF